MVTYLSGRYKLLPRRHFLTGSDARDGQGTGLGYAKRMLSHKARVPKVRSCRLRHQSQRPSRCSVLTFSCWPLRFATETCVCESESRSEQMLNVSSGFARAGGTRQW
ncbi:hypothetical protein BAUCODRAFT_333350 [Baudoinia panamericana UAMH 10762]|uniref:Uncharacterized protein n=1 Tax=Baudoinia panamericana (strain UAMH 10762) TaxID=717646 RepID=M2MWR6_BAUPA|nr:uncharacterized protein BAUCODRAFT_333350 [Baudoinia panamericana UAMH 10762]EMC91039.1 hypothetical protein BAUCODRAFT_333350 [Baudoinia panamericana UAMH 10762]